MKWIPTPYRFLSALILIFLLFPSIHTLAFSFSKESFCSAASELMEAVEEEDIDEENEGNAIKKYDYMPYQLRVTPDGDIKNCLQN
ncbi:hypothetical protein [Endozoicomonas elysicola]|uniref:Uncharacterized protein n=1 Tax=Endozoicomonas elysicola TaxID=305900 RepID=A0A081KB69_9GAMM|nr:hypothetical protein [Endozoicomonas elysicola]KEI71395.1 hypothetical protein GV64_12150 [Endozoicomonas elysicola]